MATESTTMRERPGSDQPWPPPDDWVPVDDRVLGFDKRTIWPGLVVLAVWAIWVHVLPAVDRAVDFDNPVELGDVVDLGGGELTMVPAVGWNLEEGVLVSEEAINPAPLGSPLTAIVNDDQISFTVQVAPWEDDAEALLDRALDIDDALDVVLAEDVQDSIDIVNADGVPGVLAPYTGTEQNGFVATFVFDDASPSMGATVLVVADLDAEEELADDVVGMLQSIRFGPGTDEEGEG